MPEITPPPYNAYGQWLQQRFGRRVVKIPVDAGFSCPNRDGRTGSAGCAFCVNEAFSPPARTAASKPRRLISPSDLRKILDAALVRRGCGNGAGRPAALIYFQPYSNTYAPVEHLRALYETALSLPGVIGLAIGTRPDCVTAEIIELLAALARCAYIQLELGLPTANDDTLRRLARGHDTACFEATMAQSRGRGFDICAHMIAWLPGETAADALRTAALIAAAGITGIKIHHFHVLRGSALAAEHAFTPLHLPTMEEHVKLAADILERLPWHITVQRLASWAAAEWLVAPAWTLNANAVPPLVAKTLAGRRRRQGDLAI